jgi:lysyl-tRNA synthetase, class II
MSDQAEYEVRRKKLASLREAGVDPYPSSSGRTHTIAEGLARFEELAKQKKNVVLAGRIRSIRGHGGSAFAHLEDGSGKFQVYFKKDEVGDTQFVLFKDSVDVGDFLEVGGTFFVTKAGEHTLLVKKFQLLSKALRPLPEKWHGLADKEVRFRKRYLDLVMNKEVRGIFAKRTEIIRALRDFLDTHGFMEVETPILQPLYGGASAKPFTTHLNALHMDMYLRIACELYLKRLLVGGFDRVYEFARSFRNEGMDREHNPDFTMLEFYAAYWDWEDMMRFTEEMLSQFGLPKKWDRVEYKDIVKGGDEKAAYAELKKPTFVLGLPGIPLAKGGQAVQGVVEGVELLKIFTEQNDPEAQRAAFEAQEKGDEVQPVDEDFIEALEHGMPPAAGIGIGIDRLVMLLTNAKSLRETILFPMMKPKR